MNIKGKKRSIFSILLTLIVIAIYLIPNFAQAVSVDITLDRDEFIPSDTIVGGDLTINIRDGEIVPIQNLILFLDDVEVCRFNVDGSIDSGCVGITIIRNNPGEEDFVEGDQTGTDEATGDSVDLGYGYGYGYGYGLAYDGLLSYRIEGDKAGIGEGEHTFKISVNAVGSVDSHFYSEEASFTVSSTAADLEVIESFVCPGDPKCFSQDDPKAGENLVVTFVVENKGDGAPLQSIEYKIDNSPETNIEVDTGVKLAPGKIMRVHAKYSYATADTYNPVITLDPNDKIPESDELNNVDDTLSTTVV